MEEVLTESFCERCGTRYEFEAPTRLNTLRKTRGLVSGLKNYILSQDALGDAIGDAMRSEEESLASNQLAAFHEAFNFCINCRQYACTNCWNDAAGRCRTCAPIPGVDDLDDRMEAAYLADHAAMHGGALLDREMATDEISRRLSVDAWPQTDLTEAPVANGHAAVEWPTEPGLVQYEPPAEREPVAAEIEVEPIVAAEPVPEPFLAEEPVPEPVAPEVSPVLDWESDAEALIAAVFAEPAQEPEPEPEPAAAAIVEEPEPEPAVAGVMEDPEPEPAIAAEFSQPELAMAQISDEPAPEAEWLVEETAAALEPEPEPIFAEAEPEPVAAEEALPEPVVAEEALPEPVVAEEAEVEAEQEPLAPTAAAQDVEMPEPVAELPPPTPIAPRRIVPISETVIPAPQGPQVSQPPKTPQPLQPPARQPLHRVPVAAEAPPMDEAALAARKAQLELLGIDDPGVGTVTPVRPDRLAYRSRGAGTHPSELVHRTLGSSPLWDASAREVAAARSVVAVQNCGGCGLSLSASARFCRRCGTRQAQPA